MKTKLFLLPALLLGTFLHAQRDSAKPAFLKPYSFEIAPGYNFYQDAPLSLAEMQQVAPGSTTLQKDFSTYDAGNMTFYSGNVNSSFTANVSFVPYSKRRQAYSSYTTLHAGFFVSNVQVNGPGYEETKEFPFDTLTDSQGTQFYLDSASRKLAQFNWSEKLLGIDIGQTFHTDDRRIFSFWTGYGAELAIGLDTRFKGYYSESHYKKIVAGVDPSTNTSFAYYGDGQQYDARIEGGIETIKTKNVAVARVYFPLGVQVRFSRKNNFWNRFALTMEMRMGLDIQPLPGGNTINRFFINQSGGLKFYFANNATKIMPAVTPSY